MLRNATGNVGYMPAINRSVKTICGVLTTEQNTVLMVLAAKSCKNAKCGNGRKTGINAALTRSMTKK